MKFFEGKKQYFETFSELEVSNSEGKNTQEISQEKTSAGISLLTEYVAIGL